MSFSNCEDEFMADILAEHQVVLYFYSLWFTATFLCIMFGFFLIITSTKYC